MAIQQYAKEVMNNLVKQLTTDKIVTFMKSRLFSDEITDIPRFKWSFANQLVCCIHGTYDARGYKQWQQVGRNVKKGAKAMQILAPMIISKDDFDKKGNILPDKKKVCVGFRTINVFAVEDTEGKDLNYGSTFSWDDQGMHVKGVDVNKLPLIEVAKKMGVDVKLWVGVGEIYGRYQELYLNGEVAKKEILLNTDDPAVFLHELSHAIDAFLPDQKKGDKIYSEVVAELSSAFLASLYHISFNVDSVKAYIESYTGKQHVFMKISEALERVEEIYTYITSQEKKDE